MPRPRGFIIRDAWGILGWATNLDDAKWFRDRQVTLAWIQEG